MTGYIARRLLGILPQSALLLALVVVLVRLAPGSVIDAIVLDTGQLTPEARENLEDSLGLNDPIPVQYANYAWNAVRGDLGDSIFLNRPVTTIVRERLGVTMELAIGAVLLSVAVGIPFGVYTALRRGKVGDYVIRIGAVVGLGIPNFVLATCLVVLPALWFHWRPPLFVPWGENQWSHIQSMALPTLSISIVFMAALIRVTRASMIEVMNQDYVRTARAKGLSNSRVWLVHGLRNALMPTVTLIGLEFAALISGAVIVEQVFSLPGLGDVMIRALRNRDYPVIQGMTLLIGVIVVLVNVAVDVAYIVIDPRLAHGSRA